MKNARLLLESGIVRGGLAVQDGKIVSIASEIHLPPAADIVDADNKIIMPGLIDAHAHIHDPDMLSHEDFTTGSQAAAGGGVTTFVDMPLTNQMDTESAIEKHINEGNNLSLVDFTLYAGMMNSHNWNIVSSMVKMTAEAYRTSASLSKRTSTPVAGSPWMNILPMGNSQERKIARLSSGRAPGCR